MTKYKKKVIYTMWNIFRSLLSVNYNTLMKYMLRQDYYSSLLVAVIINT